MSHRFLLALALGLAGCSDAQSGDERLVVPESLAELRSDALACMRDVEFAPLEHSEHCVFVAENLFDDSRSEKCEDERGTECQNYSVVMNDIHYGYHSAVIDSLIKYGVPERIKKIADGDPVPRFAYYDGELIREMYVECLSEERDALARNGLQPVTTIPIRPLKEGQFCFRRGYPQFETKVLEASQQT